MIEAAKGRLAPWHASGEHRADVGHSINKRDARVIRLFGVDVHDTTIESAVSTIVESAHAGRPMDVAFLNAHCINTLYHDDEYRRAIVSADRVFSDGIGMRIAARVSGMELADNVNGTDLFPVLCDRAAQVGLGLFFLGGAAGVAEAAARRMQAAHQGLDVCGTHHGFFSGPDDEARQIAEINASGAQIVLVGLGVPLQDVWIARNRHRLTAPVIIGVGGLFDYYSDRIPRAPIRLRKAGLEWVWRLAMEPRRLARRYILGNIEFLARLLVLRLLSPAHLGQPQVG